MNYYKPRVRKESVPTLRRSQCITTFGVGAIADLTNLSVMICSIDKWDSRACKPLEDRRLEEKLSVIYFLTPPDSESSSTGIKAVVFPRWLRCRKCKSLRHIEVWRERAADKRGNANFDEKPFCYQCLIPLIPSRFVVACRKGHIDDFPYMEWAHKGEVLCNNPDLVYEERGNTASLSGIVIRCTNTNCGKEQNLGRTFTKEHLASVTTCKGIKPWEMKWSGNCGEELTTLQRGGTNVHFPVLQSSILIPPFLPESLKTKIVNTKGWAVLESQIGAISDNEISFLIKIIANELNEDIDAIKIQVKQMLKNDVDHVDNEKSEESYRFEEYNALLGHYDKKLYKGNDFLIDIKNPDEYNLPYLKNIVLAKKLREIRVQVGFTRIRPPQNSDESGLAIPDEELVETVPVASSKKIRWLPGYEVRGEGIFLEFNEDRLHTWAEKEYVKKRVKNLVERSKKTPDLFTLFTNLTPELVLLHTFSHVLIRQLSFDCGYSSSALRERIYCSSDQNKRRMAGILIYTAEGGSDGTLGGLVKQGEPSIFSNTALLSLVSAQWCSSDPVCIESEGQGYHALNLAACHSCTLLPETSCEMMNKYLDRGLLVGTMDNHDLGFFTEWIKEME